MTTDQNNYTFKALLDMALGSPELTQKHLALLHCLINALLQKLNSQNEIVKIKGFEAQCLVKLLKECHDPPYECKISNDQCIGSKLEKLQELEERSNDISKKLEQHFNIARGYKRKLDMFFSGDRWDFYTGNAEDICSVPGRQCIEFCEITCHGIFNQKLRKYMTEPVLKRLDEIEKRIDNISQMLKELFKKTSIIFEEKNFLGPLISIIEKTRHQINTDHNEFLVAMKEVQEMLDAKLDRIAYPALKTYLKRFFETTEKTLLKIQRESKFCPIIKPLVISKGTCLSCGVQKKCSIKKTDEQIETGCPPYMALCKSQPEISLRTRMQYLNINLATAASQYETNLFH